MASTQERFAEMMADREEHKRAIQLWVKQMVNGGWKVGRLIELKPSDEECREGIISMAWEEDEVFAERAKEVVEDVYG